MSAAPALSALQRQLLALNGEDVPLSDWECGFVADVCWRKPETLSERQRITVELLCWRKKDHLAPDLVPTREPKFPRDTPAPKASRR